MSFKPSTRKLTRKGRSVCQCKVRAEVFLVYWLWTTYFHTVEKRNEPKFRLAPKNLGKCSVQA